MSTRYSHEKLKGRLWHKVVFGVEISFSSQRDYDQNRLARMARVKAALPKLVMGKVLARNCGATYVVMVESSDDLVLLKMLVGFSDEEYRGYGDWFNVKQHSAATNRIPSGVK